MDFLALNPVSAYLVAFRQPNKTNSDEKMLKIARKLKHPTLCVAIQGVLEILRELRAAGAILRTWLR